MSPVADNQAEPPLFRTALVFCVPLLLLLLLLLCQPVSKSNPDCDCGWL
jgi:hypothetical protein